MPRDVIWWVLRKLGAEEWLVKIGQSMYRNAQSCVRVNCTVTDDFLVQVGLNKGSVLSPLLFTIVLDAISREISSGCPQELFYADDLALVPETIEGLKGRLETWKGTLESEGLKVNLKKTKMMISENAGKVTKEATFPCAVSRNGVGNNSILSQICRC